MRIPIRITYGAMMLAEVKFQAGFVDVCFQECGLDEAEAVKKIVRQFNLWASNRLNRRVCARRKTRFLAVSWQVVRELDIGVSFCEEGE